MSVWKRFEKEYLQLSSCSTIYSKHEFIEPLLQDFIGTLSQITEEKARLEKEYNNYCLAQRKANNDKINELFSRYNEALNTEYSHVPPEVFSLAYGLAYDHGHSSGYGEVENYIGELLDPIMRAYKLGQESERSKT